MVLMKFLRTVMIIGVVISFSLWPLIAQGEMMLPSAYSVPHFVLVSQTNKVDWSGGFNTAGSAAMVLAWFANHGYTRLLTDLNNDGRINELDTAELADLFADRMKTNSKRKSPDPHFVVKLARYISNKYPREFKLDVYDTSFLLEYQKALGKNFDTADFPDIVIEIKDGDPPYPHYALGMLHVKWNDIPDLTEESSSYFLTTSEPLVETNFSKQSILKIAEDICSITTEGPTVFRVYTEVTRGKGYDRYVCEVVNEDLHGDSYFIDYVYIPNPDKLLTTNLVVPPGWTGWVLMSPGLSGWLWETGFCKGIGGDEKIAFSFSIPSPTTPVTRTVRLAGPRGYPCYCMEFAKYLETLGPGL